METTEMLGITVGLAAVTFMLFAIYTELRKLAAAAVVIASEFDDEEEEEE